MSGSVAGIRDPDRAQPGEGDVAVADNPELRRGQRAEQHKGGRVRAVGVEDGERVAAEDDLGLRVIYMLLTASHPLLRSNYY